MSHAEFLRPHWPGQDTGFLCYIRALWEIGDRLSDRVSFKTVVHDVESAFPIPDKVDRAIVRLATRLTVSPALMTRDSVQDALAQGLDERSVHDVVLITALFAFMNRLADGTGVMIQDNRRAFGIELFGQQAVKHHLAWGQPT